MILGDVSNGGAKQFSVCGHCGHDKIDWTRKKQIESSNKVNADLARYVGCRRVVLPKRRHSKSCRRHVATRHWSCRRHKKMSCRLDCLNDTTFDDMSGDSRHVGNFVIVV